MATKYDIVCRYGNILGSTTNTSGGGTKQCSACKQEVKYSVSKDRVSTAYQK